MAYDIEKMNQLVSDLEENIKPLVIKELCRVYKVEQKLTYKDYWELNPRVSLDDIWIAKKKVLKQRYNLTWKSPRDLNKTAIFD